jgi:hypothetical protein
MYESRHSLHVILKGNILLEMFKDLKQLATSSQFFLNFTLTLCLLRRLWRYSYITFAAEWW